MLSDIQINKLIIAIKESKEYQSLMKKTQVLNERKKSETATRGAHIEEVADISYRIVDKLKEQGFDKDENGNKLNPKLAELIGLCHDLGHTPFGHDGELALNNCLINTKASKEYLLNRRKNFGDKYEDEQEEKEKASSKEQVDKNSMMRFVHNEHSAEIFLKICKQNNINREDVQDVVDGILAHSTSRVEENPSLVEQQAVRIADKIAYINRDTYDLLNENVINIESVPKNLKNFVKLTPEERIDGCIDDMIEEYRENREISGGYKQMQEIKKNKVEILKLGKNFIENSKDKDEIMDNLLETLSPEKQKEVRIKWKEYGRKNEVSDLLKIVKREKKNGVLGKYDLDVKSNINKVENKIVNTKNDLNLKFPTMSKCYSLKDMNDKVIFDRDVDGIAKTGNKVKQTQREISILYYYYLNNPLAMKENVSDEFKGYTKEEQVAFYISGLENEDVNRSYKYLMGRNLSNSLDNKNEITTKIGIEKGEVSPTNDDLLENIGEFINYEENKYDKEKQKDILINIEDIRKIAETRNLKDINKAAEEIIAYTYEKNVNKNSKEIER